MAAGVEVQRLRLAIFVVAEFAVHLFLLRPISPERTLSGMPRQLISSADAAARLGITRRRVQQLILSEILPAYFVGRSYAIDPADLPLAEQRTRQRGPVPRKSSSRA
jgi:excisionase family DNA binding protein